jgi:hypothetical protein
MIIVCLDEPHGGPRDGGILREIEERSRRGRGWCDMAEEKREEREEEEEGKGDGSH